MPDEKSLPLDLPDIDSLLADDLAPLFWPPSRLGVDSAWYGHVPFGQWIVRACQPRSLVELGTHNGVSYAAFCETVLRDRLPTRCLAVDTWEGDDHAGFYDQSVYEDLNAFHEQRYTAFSRLLRTTFDAALETVPDGSVDLLHIDGRHGYDDVSHDFMAWRPKLSPRGVVLFHDVNEYSEGFGVWRLWHELSRSMPSFEFLHAHGLGVLAVGRPPGPVAALCALPEGEERATIRHRFALLGERWRIDVEHRRLAAGVPDLQRHTKELEGKFAELIAYTQGVTEGDYGTHPDSRRAMRTELRRATARSVAAELEQRRLAAVAARAEAEAEAAKAAAAHARTEAARLRQDAETSRTVAAAVLGSSSWRVTKPLRMLSGVLGGGHAVDWPMLLTPSHPIDAAQDTVSAEPAAAAAPAKRPRVLYAAGEPETPGCQYRCVRFVEAAQAAGWDASWCGVHEIGLSHLEGAALVVLWRVEWSQHVAGILHFSREFGARVALDLDDLMIDPSLAQTRFIDGIRFVQVTEIALRDMFKRIEQVQHGVDLCIATTEELADRMRLSAWYKPTYVLPNGFDRAGWQTSRLAARRRRAAPAEEIVRLGYASGTRTHQRDFGRIAPALRRVLEARPNVRLVLFKSAIDQNAIVFVDEFIELEQLGDRIEWRETVPLDRLPDELARFDVNLVPLETGNPFVEAKSELKYFEAALAGVCTIASPTGPYRRVIQHDVTGLLADSVDEWEAGLLRLIDDPSLRDRLARDAYHDILWRFGPERRADLLTTFLGEQIGETADRARVARDFALDLHARPGDAVIRRPVLVPARTAFAHDALGQAQVTVVIASFNYADFVLEALESVRLQTLDPLDLVVVDDCSTDPATMELILEWAQTQHARFNRLLVLQHDANAGLGATRNTGFAAAETPYVLPLDADNRLLPQCAERLLAAITPTRAAYAYPTIQNFGAEECVRGGDRYQPQRFVGGNYIDAMALVAKWAWAAADGYYVQRDAMGWEDYGLWARLAELAQWGLPVPELLAEYRVHDTSMTNEITETDANKRAMVALLERRHAWARLIRRGATPRITVQPSR